MILRTQSRCRLLAVLAGLASLLTPQDAVADSLYAANYGNSTIEKFTPAGASSLFANTFLAAPIGLAFDSAGNLYVTNNGSFIEKLTPGGSSSTFANTHLLGAFGLAFDGAGNLYAANVVGNTIAKFTPEGVGSVFASTGLNGPKGLAVDRAGNVYAANSGNDTIVKFTPEGVGSVFASVGLHNAYGLAFDSVGNLYAVNANDATVEKFTPNGVATLFASTGSNNALGLAIDSGDNVYVSNFSNNTIQKITPAGVGAPFANTGLSWPTGLAFRPRPITLSKLLDTTATAIPGGTGNFTSLRSPTFPADAGQPSVGGGGVAFVGAGAGGQQGIYHAAIPSDPVIPSDPIKLADLNTAIPDGTGNFTGFFPQLSTHGGATALLANGAEGQQGVYVLAVGPPIVPGDPASGIGPPIRLADLNTALPEGTGNFTSFPLVSPTVSNGHVAFRGAGSAGQDGIYVLQIGPPIVPGGPATSNGPPIRVADLNTAIPAGAGNFTGFTGSPAVSGENLAFVATGAGSQQGVYRVLQIGPPIFPGGPASIIGPPIKVADTATAMPGSADSFQFFQSVSMDRSVVSAALAFVGGGTVGGVPMKGVYTAIAGPPIKVADSATLIPAGSGMFSDFGAVAFDPDAAGNPITAFLGFGSAGQQGIYAHFEGALRKVVDLVDVLDGKTPVSFTLGTSGLDLGKLTFTATFSDGSEGLYSSALPLVMPADFDEDGDVDADDLASWRSGFGTSGNATHLQGDANRDLSVDGGDFLAWQRQLGSGATVAALSIVPEPPTTLLILGCAAVGMLSRRRRCQDARSA